MLLPYLLSYAIGAPLSAALMRMLPKAMTILDPVTAMQYLRGVVLYKSCCCAPGLTHKKRDASLWKTSLFAT